MDLLDVALVFALQGGAELKVQAGMDRPQWYRHMWNAERRSLGRRTVAVFALAIFGFPLALQGRLMQDGVNEPAFLFRLYS